MLSNHNKDKEATNKRRTLDERLTANFNNRMAKMARWESMGPAKQYTTSQNQDVPVAPMPRYTASQNQGSPVTPMARYTESRNQDKPTQATAQWVPMEPPTRYSPGTTSKQAAPMNMPNKEQEPLGTMIMTANPDTPMVYMNVKGNYYKIPMNQCTDPLKAKLIEAVSTGKLD